jgi:hypothetical protein
MSPKLIPDLLPCAVVFVAGKALSVMRVDLVVLISVAIVIP